jgi:histidinol-phosphate aminotransferase
MSLQFKSEIVAAPLYSSDPAIEAARSAWGLNDILEMGSNESPLGPSPLAVEAMQQAVATLNRYPSLSDEALRDVLAGVIGQGLTPDNFVTGNGGLEVLAMIATAFLDKGDECVICRPTFPIYAVTAYRAGATVVYVDLNPDHFNYDVEAILAAVTPQTRVVYVCSPNNPTGNILTAAHMETLVNNLPPRVLLVADEVYHHFVADENYHNSLAYIEAGKNLIILRSFSKAYSLAGLRLGYGIAPAAIAQYLARTRRAFHLNSVTIAGGIAALRDKSHLEKNIELVIRGRQWLTEQLIQLGLPTWSSQGNFILFKPPFAAGEVSQRLLKHGLVVRAMARFYLPAHMRVTVGLPEENERFIVALRSILAEMKEEGPSTLMAAEAGDNDFKF